LLIDFAFNFNDEKNEVPLLLIDFTFNFNDEGITAFEELSCL
jgi:hypothetical protein